MREDRARLRSLLLLVLRASLVTGCLALLGCSGMFRPAEVELPSDFSYSYRLTVGSVGPPYWYSLDVAADASTRSGEATIAMLDQPDSLSLTLSFSVHEEELLVVLREMIDNRFFRPGWDSMMCPDGAAGRRVEATAHGRHVRVPPEDLSGCIRDRDSLEDVCDAIWESVPATIRDSLMAERESWIIGEE